MQIAVLCKRAVGMFLSHFHNCTLLEQFVYISLELGYIVFILQIEYARLPFASTDGGNACAIVGGNGAAG